MTHDRRGTEDAHDRRLSARRVKSQESCAPPLKHQRWATCRSARAGITMLGAAAFCGRVGRNSTRLVRRTINAVLLHKAERSSAQRSSQLSPVAAQRSSAIAAQRCFASFRPKRLLARTLSRSSWVSCCGHDTAIHQNLGVVVAMPRRSDTKLPVCRIAVSFSSTVPLKALWAVIERKQP